MNLRFLSFLRKMRCVTARRRKAHVPLAAVAATCKKFLFPVRIDIAKHFSRLRIPHQRAERDRDHHVIPAFSEPIVRSAAFSVACREFCPEPKIDQIAFVLVAYNIYVAALSAVAAVRAAVRKAFEALERIHSVAAVARFDRDLNFIRKQRCHCHCSPFCFSCLSA